MGSAYFSASIPDVRGLGQRLGEIAATVSSGAVFQGASGAEAYEDLVAALGDFEEDWDNAVARLEEKTHGLGGAPPRRRPRWPSTTPAWPPPSRAGSRERSKRWEPGSRSPATP